MSQQESSDSTAPNRPTDSEHEVDVWERTKGYTGPAEAMNRRLFMQLLVFDCGPDQDSDEAIQRLAEQLTKRGIGAVIYQDVNNPYGIGLLSFSEAPADFVDAVRPAIGESEVDLTLNPDFTMLGRTYASGYEPNLGYWLLQRPQETVLNEAWPWAIWYPLRRSGDFEQLSPQEQGAILKEHAVIGKAYGAQDLAHDVRLACHGLDTNDNEFVLGLIGKDLHPLSHLVQSMRKTRQTSEFIVQMGPFFVGKVAARCQPQPPAAS